MGDPQHYQPLSQALNPPTQPVYSSTGLYQPSKAQHISNLTSTPQHRPEEEEEEEEDDEDEGMVEEQLNSRNEADNHGSNPASPHNKGTGPSASQKLQTQPSTQPTQPQDPSSSSTQQQPQKRRPGRPRGSKNRKPRVVSGTSTMKPDQSASFYVASNVPQNQAAAPAPQPQSTTTAAPPSFPEINNQNHHYYEFQWRVLNLCAEFYGAAEELVKATPPLVVAQCYQMMPDSKVDPLSMLAEAKRICDTLLNNPSRLIQNPPPPMYPTAPQLYHGQTATSAAPVTAPAPSTSVSAPSAAPATSTASTSAKPAPIASTSSAPATTTPATVITNPQQFVMSMGTQTGPYPHAQYGVYAPTQYPSYYPAPYAYPTGYYQAQPQIINPQVAPTTNPTQTVTAPQASSSNPTPAVQPQASTSSSGPATQTAPTNAHGAWSEEEVDRLKKLFEESRTKASTAEAQWDWVIRQFGSRTRTQIYTKAASLGLREAPSRGVKRRREHEATDDANASHPPPPPPPQPTASTPSSSTAIIPNATTVDNRPTHSTPQPPPPITASPSQPHATPGASPALPHTQRPPSTSTTSNTPTTATATKSNLPWPMPTVAANTPSPVMVSANLSHAHNHGHGHSGHTGHSNNANSSSSSNGQPGHMVTDPQRATSYYRARTAIHSVVEQGSKQQQPTTHSYMYQPNGNAGRLGKDGGK